MKHAAETFLELFGMTFWIAVVMPIVLGVFLAFGGAR